MARIMGAEANNLKSFILDWVVPILGAIVLAVILHKFVIFKVAVPTGSMIPTIMPGDQLFVTRSYNKDNIERGDIIVFHSDELNDDLIKRVIGIPGDTVEVKNTGEVFVNNELLKEEYVKNPSNKTATFKVPTNKFLMLGDNRADSLDARYWVNPYIDADKIMGKARLRVYPFNRMGSIK